MLKKLLLYPIYVMLAMLFFAFLLDKYSKWEEKKVYNFLSKNEIIFGYLTDSLLIDFEHVKYDWQGGEKVIMYYTKEYPKYPKLFVEWPCSAISTCLTVRLPTKKVKLVELLPEIEK